MEQHSVPGARFVDPKVRARIGTLERLALAVDPGGRLPLALWGSIGQRLAPRLAPPLQARLVPPQADALQGALQLLSRQFA